MPLDRTSRARSFLVIAAAYASAGIAAAAACALAAGRPPAVAAFLADIAATVVIFAFSLGLDNSSMYDPYWSVAPVPIALSWLQGPAGRIDARQVIALALLFTWAARLTANWARRWKGLNDEDWRYKERRGSGAAYWPISFLGFHLMPTVLVFFGCLPLLPVLSGTGFRGIRALDMAALVVTAGAIIVEAAADRQLRRFLAAPRAPGRVLDTGLWALSRHPNYFGEVAFWWGLWLFGLSADPSWWWTIVGPAAITALFLGISIPMMDRRMRARHPGYESHMAARSAFIPWPSRRGA
jgi:steroid 5-alpha reductase family enzyme